MKTKKDLAKYLADYGAREDELRVGGINPENVAEVIEQGLEAFESTENVQILEKQKVVISLCSGIVELKSAPENVQVILHDYDLQECEPDNPDRTYDEDSLGVYEVTEL